MLSGARAALDGPPPAPRVPTKGRSLAERFPKVARDWHPAKNRPLKPIDVFPGTGRVVWWRCQSKLRHEWQAPVQDRVRASRCPFCSGRRVTAETSLAALHPAIAREWHPTKNHPLTPGAVRPGSDVHVWWRCTRNERHEWETKVGGRTGAQRNGCPYCAGQRVTAETSLARLHPKLAREWHPTKNGPLAPTGVGCGADRKVWWRCGRDPRHEWQAAVYNRTRGRGCPYCAGQRATRETSLAVLCPKLAREWHPTRNRPLTPYDVVLRSGKKVSWRCAREPRHVWEATVDNRMAGRGCPYCAGQRVTPETSLARLHPTLAREWHPTKNQPHTPSMVRPGSGKRVWWRCPFDRHHEWQTQVSNRTGAGSGCPHCYRESRRRRPRRRSRLKVPILAR